MKGFLGAFLVFIFWASGGIYYISKTNPELSDTAVINPATTHKTAEQIATQETTAVSQSLPVAATEEVDITVPDSTIPQNNSSNSQLLAAELKKSITISDTIDINKGEPELSFEEDIPEKEEEEARTQLFYPRYTASQELILDRKLVNYAKELKQILKDSPDKKITIIGHTDNIGSAKDNFAIALKKSRQVKWYLTARKGMPRSRIRATSKGEQEPIESNNSNWGRKKNNRIEIIVE